MQDSRWSCLPLSRSKRAALVMWDIHGAQRTHGNVTTGAVVIMCHGEVESVLERCVFTSDCGRADACWLFYYYQIRGGRPVVVRNLSQDCTPSGHSMVQWITSGFTAVSC